GTGAVFVYGGLRVINGSITVGTFVAFMAYQMRFLPPLQALMGMYANLATVRVSLRRVAQILDEPVDVIEAADAVDLPSVRGDVEFDEVTVSFGRGGPVLERFSFSVRAGETLAIVGPSGSGKSTIADLLLRLIDPDAGAVRLDGHNLRTVRLADLRRRVALVEQEPCILHATIAENLRAPHRRWLRVGDARPHHHRHHTPPRPRAQGRPRHRGPIRVGPGTNHGQTVVRPRSVSSLILMRVRVAIIDSGVHAAHPHVG